MKSLFPMLAALVLLLSPTPLLADEGKGKALARYFGANNSCYGRALPQEGLKTGAVRAIRLDHFPRNEGFFDDQGAKRYYPDTPEIVVNLGIWLVGRDEPQVATGFCWPDGSGMACGLECDAGQFTLTAVGKGKLRLMPTSTLQFEGCADGRVALPDGALRQGMVMLRQPAEGCKPPKP